MSNEQPLSPPPAMPPPPSTPPPAYPAGGSVPAGLAWQPPPQRPGGPSGPRAGFFPRLGARLIDGIVLGIPAAVLFFLAFSIGGTEVVVCEDPFNDGAVGLCRQPTSTAVGLAFLAGLATLVGFIFYEALLTGGKSGQTLGKRAMGIRVIDYATGGPIGTGRAIGRYLVSIISGIPFYLGYFWSLWDDEKQTWHDKAANCVVVPVTHYPVQR